MIKFRRIICVIVLSLITIIPALTSAYASYHTQTLAADDFGPPAVDQNGNPIDYTNGGTTGGQTNGGTIGGPTNGGTTGGQTNGGTTGGPTNGGTIGGPTNGNTTGGQTGTLQNELGNNINNLCDFVNAVLNIIAQMGAIVAVLFIIWSGFLFIKAQGNREEIKRAKSTFFTTIAGTAILLGASIITKIIFNTISSVSTAVTGHNGGGICSS